MYTRRQSLHWVGFTMAGRCESQNTTKACGGLYTDMPECMLYRLREYIPAIYHCQTVTQCVTYCVFKYACVWQSIINPTMHCRTLVYNAISNGWRNGIVGTTHCMHGLIYYRPTIIRQVCRFVCILWYFKTQRTRQCNTLVIWIFLKVPLQICSSAEHFLC